MVQPLTRVRARYPRERGELRLRGAEGTLSWDRDTVPTRVEGDVSIFEVPVPNGHAVEAKLIRGDGAWAAGRNVVLCAGDELELRPSFDRTSGALGPWYEHPVKDRAPLRFRVLVPPSYDEQPDARYPVIYALDGQALWSDSTDPFGFWQLDRTLNDLWDLRAVEELIVVSIDTSHERLHHLSPVPDPVHGGGGGEAHLRSIVEELKPQIDRTLRTRPLRESTAILGSSLGGLFAFYAAWQRPDVFGAAICLSSSFWWADRWAVRTAEGSVCPAPRPRLYLDSGAARSAGEPHASTRDGLPHTRAVERALIGHCYEPSEDLDVLTFPGHRHDAESWAARVAIPLQLVFPRGDA